MSDLNETLILSTDFRKIIKYQNFIKIRPMGAQFQVDGRTDGQTEKTRLSVAFRYFANAPKYIRVTADSSY
jgi:hypothetical protein